MGGSRDSATEGGQPSAPVAGPDASFLPPVPSERAEMQSESSSNADSHSHIKGEPAPCPPNQPDVTEKPTCDDFNLVWKEMEEYVKKRFSEGPQSLLPLASAVDLFKRQKLRVEELAFLLGNSFPDTPDMALCMSLFLPDRTLINTGNSAQAVCTLIQNIAPDKYFLFSSILQGCVVEKTQRASRDMVFHRMQQLFRLHPLIIRAIRKLVVQQYCMERNSGVIRKGQAIELAKPFDDEPLQVHSAFRLAYQVGVSSGCADRARLLASNVLHLIRMFLSHRVSFSSFSEELDRMFSGYSSWFHVSGDIKQLVLTISDDDKENAKELAKVVKLLAGRSVAACEDRGACLRYLCDLFLNGVANQSVTLRIEVDHLVERARRGNISASLAMQRIASLLTRFPECCEKLGVLVRLFRDIAKREKTQSITKRQARDRPSQLSSGSRNGVCSPSPSTDEAPAKAKDSEVDDAPTHNAVEGAVVQASDLPPRISEQLLDVVRRACDALCLHVAPFRFRSQDVMIQLMGYSWVDPIYQVVDDWNAGLISKGELFSAFETLAFSSPKALEALRRLPVVFEAKRGLGGRTAPLTRQQYDSWPRNGSYRKLPDELPPLQCSGRDKLSWQVFNDRWALFPDSSESQARYMNRHEEALLSLADCRYEWDLRITRLESCIKKLEAIAEELVKMPKEERKNCTVRPSFFRQIHVACFRRIFGANTEQVLSCLCASPLASLETVYSTLEFKLVQWKAMGEVLGAYWTSQEQPHYSGAIDFRKKFLGDKRGGVDVEELRVECKDSRNKAARVVKIGDA